MPQRDPGDLADGAVLREGTGTQVVGEVGIDAHLYARRDTAVSESGAVAGGLVAGRSRASARPPRHR